MKKVFAMFAAILFCGSMMVSCNKETDTIENHQSSTADVNPADLLGKWEGTYNGSTNYQDQQLTYTIKWNVDISTVSAGTMTALVTSNLTDENYTVRYIISGVSSRQNTDYVELDVRRDGALFDDRFEMLYNKSANTLTGSMSLQYQDDLTIGGETTLEKK